MKRILVAAVAVLALAACSKPKGNAESTAVSDTVQIPADRLTSTPSTTAPDGTPNSDLAPAPAK
jgi:uncharacterized lipoprotein YajG